MADDAFEQLALMELEGVYRLARHLCGSVPAAEDAVQETYLRAFKAAETYRAEEGSMRPWLFKILHNVIYSRATREQQERRAVGELALDTMEASPTEEVASGQVNWEGVDGRLKAAIDELPLELRTPFLLSTVEEMKYREIAEITGVALGTVMSRLFRARAVLARRLRGLAGEQGLGRKGGEAL